LSVSSLNEVIEIKFNQKKSMKKLLLAIIIVANGLTFSTGVIAAEIMLLTSYKSEWYSIPQEDRNFALDCLKSKVNGNKFVITKLEYWEGQIRVWGDMYLPDYVIKHGQPVKTDRFLGNTPQICGFKAEAEEKTYKETEAKKKDVAAKERELEALALMEARALKEKERQKIIRSNKKIQEKLAAKAKKQEAYRVSANREAVDKCLDYTEGQMKHNGKLQKLKDVEIIGKPFNVRVEYHKRLKKELITISQHYFGYRGWLGIRKDYIGTQTCKIPHPNSGGLPKLSSK
jgi:hypothetical protein